MINFTISEFNISGKSIPQRVCDMILLWHIVPMQRVRNVLGIAIWPSQKSSYRPKWWERLRKRNGKSQHVFEDKGATDWTCEDFKANKDELLKQMIIHTEYTRLAVYRGFIHGDYKTTPSGRREIYISGKDSRWSFLKFAD